MILGFDDTDYAWAAGLFDGEGSVVISNPKDRPNPRIHLTVSMTCKKTIDRFHSIFPQGNIFYKYPKDYQEKGYLPQWRWSVESAPKVVEVIKKLAPYLVTKQDKINDALEHWHSTFDPEKSRNWKNVLASVKEEMPYAI